MSVAHTEASLLHAEVRGEGELHQVPGGVERQATGGGAAELDVGSPCLHQHAVINAARRLLQVEVQERELHNEAGGGLQRPATHLRVGVLLRVAGRREDPLDVRQHGAALGGAAAQHCWQTMTADWSARQVVDPKETVKKERRI